MATGLLGIIGNQLTKRFLRKAEKHEKIKIFAEAKLDMISDMISKALIDTNMSDDKYTRILNELIKCRERKEELRSETTKMFNGESREGREVLRRKFNENRVENRVKN